MDLVHDRGSTDRVHESGPWIRSKEGGPWTPGPCFVLTHKPRCRTHKVFHRLPENTLQTESHSSGRINGDFYAQASKTILGYT